jgi:nucleotide-binding universal stress UspA family protein
MSIVLAALDSSPTARPVLETALRVARLTAADVKLLHVDEGASDLPRSLASWADLPIRVVSGPVGPTLLDAFAAPDVIVAIVGARGATVDQRPAGHTALHILERLDKPIVVVPPEAAGRSVRAIERVLLPLEGTDESSLPVIECLASLIVGDVDVIVLHVFTRETMPRVLDRPVRDLQLWADEFGARYGPTGARTECRVGKVGDEVARLAAEEDVDMAVLSWSQDASAGHAKVVRDVVARAVIPVLLLPVVAPLRPS